MVAQININLAKYNFFGIHQEKVPQFSQRIGAELDG